MSYIKIERVMKRNWGHPNFRVKRVLHKTRSHDVQMFTKDKSSTQRHINKAALKMLGIDNFTKNILQTMTPIPQGNLICTYKICSHEKGIQTLEPPMISVLGPERARGDQSKPKIRRMEGKIGRKCKNSCLLYTSPSPRD